MNTTMSRRREITTPAHTTKTLALIGRTPLEVMNGRQ